ncbi:hypothetical protein BJX99DRAFT_261345 [Aspergillus californicus]
MQFVKEKTSIPIPSVIAWGLGHQNPLKLGPFIIVELIDGEPLDVVLRQEQTQPGDAPVLRSDISDCELRVVYRQMANILLELSRHDFDRIGALSNTLDGTGLVQSRPLTLKMNETESLGGVYVGGILIVFSQKAT